MMNLVDVFDPILKRKGIDGNTSPLNIDETADLISRPSEVEPEPVIRVRRGTSLTGRGELRVNRLGASAESTSLLTSEMKSDAVPQE